MEDISNIQKYENYKAQNGRLNRALREHFYLEALFIEYAIIETNGNLSVLKKTLKDNVTAEQLGIKDETVSFEFVVISDGELAESSMKLCGVDRKWIESKLKKSSLSIEDVFIMTVNLEKGYSIIKKEI